MAKSTRLHRLRFDYLGMDKTSVKRTLANRLIYSIGKDNFTATERDWLNCVIYASRDRLIERWMETMRSYYSSDTKRVYYLSLEFLIGRTLTNSLLNLDIVDEVKESLHELGLDYENLCEIEQDAGLGNGGLGRLAACFLDSFATLRLPGYGYGIRYEYGMFKQQIDEGYQVETPDNWLRYGNPWEFARPEVLYPVRFGGNVVEYRDASNKQCYQWNNTNDVMALAYDTPIPGHGTNTVNNMRLWSARASRDFDLHYFNQGDYIQAVASKNESENLSKVLYPADNFTSGKELRLKQQYFFVSASVQDIIYRYRKHHDNFDSFSDKVAIQLNDTHPAIAIPELMRILLDEEHLEWEKAWHIAHHTFAYTNHTLMPEALETWPVSLFEKLLPRHLQIIYNINFHFLEHVRHCYPGNSEILNRVSIIGEGQEKHIRMGNLAFVGSHKVNGVAQLHTDLMKETIFADLHRLMPEKIINITNGITPRRWLNQANPTLSKLISHNIGTSWKTNLLQLENLMTCVDNPEFQMAFNESKLHNKQLLCKEILSTLGIKINPESLFDVQVKRIHEYKRQLLNVLHVISRYNQIKRGETENIAARTVLFSGKAAPSYWTAKIIIKLINDVADIVNNDPAVGDLLKVVFIPDYNVSRAELIIPAANLSEQISTAGTEASGTGNMKLALNGALTIGTLDGANIEIKNAVGDENIFIFGMTTEQVQELGAHYRPREVYEQNTDLKEVLDMIRSGYFSPREPLLFQELVDNLLNEDHYMLLADYQSYIDCQKQIDLAYKDQKSWTRKAIINVAKMGHFSSDRSIMEYAKNIWNVQPIAHE